MAERRIARAHQSPPRRAIGTMVASAICPPPQTAAASNAYAVRAEAPGVTLALLTGNLERGARIVRASEHAVAICAATLHGWRAIQSSVAAYSLTGIASTIRSRTSIARTIAARRGPRS